MRLAFHDFQVNIHRFQILSSPVLLNIFHFTEGFLVKFNIFSVTNFKHLGVTALDM